MRSAISFSSSTMRMDAFIFNKLPPLLCADYPFCPELLPVNADGGYRQKVIDGVCNEYYAQDDGDHL